MNLQTLKELREKLRRELFGFAQFKTDKAILVCDSDELAVGTDVFVEDDEGNRTPAENGDYKLEDSTTIKVAEGKVAEVVEPGERFNDNEPEGKPEYVTREEYNTAMAEMSKMYRFMEEVAAKFTETNTTLNTRLSTVEKMSAALTPKEDLETETKHITPSSRFERELENARRVFGKN